MNILGIVRLSQGEVGYYDDITRTHLTIASPEATVFEGMNTTNLKRAVKSGRIKLVSGSLESETTIQTPAYNNPFQASGSDNKGKETPEVGAETTAVNETAASVESLSVKPETTDAYSDVIGEDEIPTALGQEIQNEGLKSEDVKVATSKRGRKK